MELLQSILLGIIQGITEFIPVSSSGHLVLGQLFLGIEPHENIVMEVVLHLGTGIAIIIVFWKDILHLVKNSFSPDHQIRNEALKYNSWIIIGSIPAAIVGIGFKDTIDANFSNPYISASMLIVTALFLFFSSMRNNTEGKLTLYKVIAIGIFQAFAITPGISRSGSTIAIALLIGVSRKESGRFSFLLSLPAVFGAGLLYASDITEITVSATSLFAGFIFSLVVGVLSLKLLLNFVRRGKLYYFGYYCAAVGVITLIYLTVFTPSPIFNPS
ncbi:undecaprenyl-diphosphate phosphatase [Chitinispirillales bacterium ANBcel5]|uniref:undecaprenyl-diphosphate phosphatase n=1 Tax=Cellulosispirillum alkaliphilum TaxID=3039283 RepID=UPI002A5451A8|nr:undecaprenyl-diphosphate phosphatase [Chitinispirillales bacterium ANBcel5]